MIGDSSQEALYKVQDFNRGGANNRFEQLLRQLTNFDDQRTGTKHGSVDKWGPDKCIMIDGLTGIGEFVMSMVAGKKPVKSLADWGVAQDAVLRLIHMLCDGCRCHFVLLAHVERETDQVMGGVKVTVSTLGKALPPKIPPKFSDVILSVREGTKWSWSTANVLCDLKTRNLPVADNQPPDFRRIIDKWKSRGGKFTSTVKR
jgi:hypothetical protein